MKFVTPGLVEKKKIQKKKNPEFSSPLCTCTGHYCPCAEKSDKEKDCVDTMLVFDENQREIQIQFNPRTCEIDSRNFSITLEKATLGGVEDNQISSNRLAAKIVGSGEIF